MILSLFSFLVIQMSVTNEKSILGREQSMNLSTSQVGSVGSKKFDHRE